MSSEQKWCLQTSVHPRMAAAAANFTISSDTVHYSFCGIQIPDLVRIHSYLLEKMAL